MIRYTQAAAPNIYWNPLQSVSQSSCKWNKNFTVVPSDLECVVQYCDNPTDAPNDSHNYNYQWNGNLIPIGTSISYPCKSNHYLEQDVYSKQQAAANVGGLCNNGTLGMLIFYTANYLI